jgi:hypothetical protein
MLVLGETNSYRYVTVYINKYQNDIIDNGVIMLALTKYDTPSSDAPGTICAIHPFSGEQQIVFRPVKRVTFIIIFI